MRKFAHLHSLRQFPRVFDVLNGCDELERLSSDLQHGQRRDLAQESPIGDSAITQQQAADLKRPIGRFVPGAGCQRAMVAAKLATLGRGHVPNAPIDAFAQKQAADLLNVARRHLTASLASMVAAKLANIKVGDSVGNQWGSPIGEGHVSQQQAGDMLNVGKRTVVRA
jgi:hypothetical protein